MESTIGQRIKTLRERLGLSQEEFATQIGLSRKMLSRYEQGKNVPSEKTLRLIEQTFSVNPEWLRHGRGEMFLKKNPEEIKNLTEEALIRGLAEKLVEKLDKKLQRRGRALTEKQKEELVEMLIEELKEFGEIKTLRIEKLLSA